jgi:hypothetical protein
LCPTGFALTAYLIGKTIVANWLSAIEHQKKYSDQRNSIALAIVDAPVRGRTAKTEKVGDGEQVGKYPQAKIKQLIQLNYARFNKNMVERISDFVMIPTKQEKKLSL